MDLNFPVEILMAIAILPLSHDAKSLQGWRSGIRSHRFIASDPAKSDSSIGVCSCIHDAARHKLASQGMVYCLFEALWLLPKSLKFVKAKESLACFDPQHHAAARSGDPPPARSQCPGGGGLHVCRRPGALSR